MQRPKRVMGNRVSSHADTRYGRQRLFLCVRDISSPESQHHKLVRVHGVKGRTSALGWFYVTHDSDLNRGLGLVPVIKWLGLSLRHRVA